jgi:hypothetical protein
VQQNQQNSDGLQGQSPQTNNAPVPPAGPRMGGQGRHTPSTKSTIRPGVYQ